MRVIGGEFRSRRLKSIPGLATRPTTDRLRETLFDILGAQVKGIVFLDAYAGTGAVGIEALSRGAARTVFIEKSKNAAKILRDNLASLGVEGRALVVVAVTLSAIADFSEGRSELAGGPAFTLHSNTYYFAVCRTMHNGEPACRNKQTGE